MYKIYKILVLVVIAVTTKINSSAQVLPDSSGSSPKIHDSLPVSDTVPSLQKPAASLANLANDTTPVSVNVELENIFNAKSPKEYILS